MKILSVAIPCYNSAAYMHNAVESCLVMGEDVEIIVIDDGSSKDNTLEIGMAYREKYPGIVKCVHQENSGHGGAVNTGLLNATGQYFKVLDSDDWFDKDVLQTVGEKLKELHSTAGGVDMFIANYVYDKPSRNRTTSIGYTNRLPTNRFFSWDEVKYFYPYQNIIMHSVIYRTQLLKECGMKLPTHTFYVDNLFFYQPLPYVNKMYYMNVDLYHYFIGRRDQSVNEKVMIGRMDQQLKVNRMMIDCCDIMALENEKCRRYMIKYLTMITSVSTVLCAKSGTAEHLQARDELWKYMEEKNPALHKKVKRTAMGSIMQMRSPIGRKIIVILYSMAQKIFEFN